ncbi:MAG TPA: LysR family transcriptional regulator [Fimbriimonadaceae bacterium]|nr:LysR family transcriptional regulator [Fimbriimonadaceae bacterium]HRJ33985.1 LysR family transcriptional regulator [Fimbriimonadaceae bacterium]
MMNRLESLTYRNVEAILTVGRLGSIVGAASMLNISPSQMSRLVSHAEAALGVRLFDRNGPRIMLNAAGISLRPRLERLAEDWLEIARIAPSLESRTLGTLTLGYTRLTALTFLGSFIRTFADALPGVSIDLVDKDDKSLEEELNAKRMDAALLTSPTMDKRLPTRTVHFDPFRLVHGLGAEQALVDLDDHQFEAVLTAPFVNWLGNWSLITERCEALRIRPRFVESVNDAIGRMALCLAGRQATLVTDVRRNQVPEGLTISPIRGFEEMGYTTVIAIGPDPTAMGQRVWNLFSDPSH